MLTFKKSLLLLGCVTLCNVSYAAQDTDDIKKLRAELEAMKTLYADRLGELESKMKQIDKRPLTSPPLAQGTGAALPPPTTKPISIQSQGPANARRTIGPNTPATARRIINNSAFNPSIGIVFNGQYSSFSSEDGEIAGFSVGHEGERGREGFAADHTELNFSANVDDKFFGSFTTAVAQDGHGTEIELEEAFIQTLPGFGLPNGLTIKGGRAFWTLGYLNEHHSHVDDFADRPLPYRVFLDGAFNDDGVEFSYVLPTSFYAEIGGGLFRGDDFPFGESDGEGITAWSAYARVGGDISNNQSLRVGAYVLSGEAGERESNDDTVIYAGDTRLYVADFRYTWAPTGNANNQELTLQGEYFIRDENGTYEDTAASTGAVGLNDDSSGFYAQAVYKFHQNWRSGIRYSRLDAAGTPAGLAGSALDSGGHNAESYTFMTDWTNSEFSRVRFQYNHNTLSRGQDDNQFMLQYIMSIGAHGAHAY